jgi:hypothetical protein
LPRKRKRSAAAIKLAAQADAKREQMIAQQANKERHECIDTVTEPSTPAMHIDIVGKWSCTEADGGHALLRILGDDGAFEVTEELWEMHYGRTTSRTTELNGRVHGKALWAKSSDELNVAFFRSVSGGLRLIQASYGMYGCERMELQCTR